MTTNRRSMNFCTKFQGNHDGGNDDAFSRLTVAAALCLCCTMTLLQFFAN